MSEQGWVSQLRCPAVWRSGSGPNNTCLTGVGLQAVARHTEISAVQMLGTSDMATRTQNTTGLTLGTVRLRTVQMAVAIVTAIAKWDSARSDGQLSCVCLYCTRVRPHFASLILHIYRPLTDSGSRHMTWITTANRKLQWRWASRHTDTTSVAKWLYEAVRQKDRTVFC